MLQRSREGVAVELQFLIQHEVITRIQSPNSGGRTKCEKQCNTRPLVGLVGRITDPHARSLFKRLISGRGDVLAGSFCTRVKSQAHLIHSGNTPGYYPFCVSPTSTWKSSLSSKSLVVPPGVVPAYLLSPQFGKHAFSASGASQIKVGTL